MLYDVKKYVSSLLKSSATLTALVPASRIVFFYPKSFTDLPAISYEETNQRTADFADDSPGSVDSNVQIHVWTKNSSTNAISKVVTELMIADKWGLDFSQDLADPDQQIEHRVMRFVRKLTSQDF